MKNIKPDCILLDREMPRMSELEFVEHVKQDMRLKDIPISIISSRSTEKYKQRAAKMGVNHFLSKPFVEEELMAILQSLRCQ